MRSRVPAAPTGVSESLGLFLRGLKIFLDPCFRGGVKNRDKLSRGLPSPRKHGPRNISRPLENRPRLSETPVGAAETRLLMGPQLARSPLFQAGLRAWPDGRTFKSPPECSRPSAVSLRSAVHPFARSFRPRPLSPQSSNDAKRRSSRISASRRLLAKQVARAVFRYN